VREQRRDRFGRLPERPANGVADADNRMRAVEAARERLLVTGRR
jgi:hypothetical protein